MYGSGLAATELAATGTSGFGGVFAAGGAWPPPWALIAVNEVTNAASARAATMAVDLVERCMNGTPNVIRGLMFPWPLNPHIVIDTARMSGHLQHCFGGTMRTQTYLFVTLLTATTAMAQTPATG